MGKEYLRLIQDLKRSIAESRYQAARLANREQLYQISDVQKQLPGIRGFSYRNLRKMRQFYEAYEESAIWPSLTAKLQDAENQRQIVQSLTDQYSNFFNISFTHHVLILNKCKTDEREFYISMAATECWSVAVLEHRIDNGLIQKQGKLPNNFSEILSAKLKPSAIQLFNDEYLMDYLNLGDSADERDIENKIVNNIRDFILRMGRSFSFIGNQFRIELNGEEFFIDLLFFNRILQCLGCF